MIKNIIEVKNLSKSFDISSREHGLKGTLKHFFNREIKSIKIIKNRVFESHEILYIENRCYGESNKISFNKVCFSKIK